MGGREAVPNTHFSRESCGDPEVTVFRISGPLGPRARPYLERLTKDCLRRDLPRVVLDLSRIESLGGTTARLLNEFAAQRAERGEKTAFFVTSPTVEGLLSANSSVGPPTIRPTLDGALAEVKDKSSLLTQGVRAPITGQTAGGAGTTGGVRDDAGLDGLFQLAHPGPPSLSSPRPTDDGLGPLEGFFSDTPAASEDDAANPVGRQHRLAETLQERQLASRIHIFELHADDRYYLVTKSGIDFDRALPNQGALARRIHERGEPSFLFDLGGESLTPVEEELLTELNCEVVAPVVCDDHTQLLVFLSKERPGDEYSLEELEQIQAVLLSVSRDSTDTWVGTTQPEPQAVIASTQPMHEPPRIARQLEAEVPIPLAERAVEPSAALARPERVRSAPHGPSESARERQLRRRLTQMRDILRLNQDFDSSFETSRILEVLVLSVVSVARVETVLYFAQRGGEYRLAHHRGAYRDSFQDLRLSEDSTLVRAALASERGVRIEDSPDIVEEEKVWARQQRLQYAVAFRSKNANLGLVLFGNRVGRPDPDLEMLWYLLNQAALAYDRANLFETLQDRTLGVVRGLITLIESRNTYDCGSTEQVVRYTHALAREIQYPQDAMRQLVYGAVLRDVGMLHINESLLRSSQDLTADQWDAIRRHPVEGASIMRQMRFSNVAIDVVLHHHEAYNGDGYPMGLRGRAIPLGARIVAVAESYVKMTMDRPYRKALGRAEALESMAENWGLRYDPLVVDALVRVVNRALSIGLQGDADLTRDLFGV